MDILAQAHSQSSAASLLSASRCDGNASLHAACAGSHPICIRSAGAKARILVALRPDFLVTGGSTGAKALQAATSDIPVFFQSSSDPVGYGLVDSIAHPGRNITGIAVAPQMLWGKRLELLEELLGHRPARIAWLSNPEDLPNKLNEAAVMQSADKLGIEGRRLGGA